MGPNGPGGPTGPSGPSGPNGPGGQQMGVGYGGGANSGGPGFNNPTGQYATQPPYHSPQMQNTPGNMGVPQRFPSGPGQGGPGAPQGRSIGNPKQALQDMIRARNDPQFSSAGGKYLISIIQSKKNNLLLEKSNKNCILSPKLFWSSKRKIVLVIEKNF